ncbi:MAG: tetratricopeptide repeat protein [Leptolyngbya sp. PLA2]|nr:tetratricopeptide repeat protein [Leptolyngbya sp.]MCE7971646.1 tetratricopeptide repeat protein [Leptolyngbya sp. PL-A2]MCQ3940034.1 hypothetical protein [cyanobacterium CYA1]MCZ7633643.1 hypothetical protein [Phycisphaerales bacterium]GIK17921.1 MAG: hypothetical protein BroJett004_00850 [Planctomycetota bacterium]
MQRLTVFRVGLVGVLAASLLVAGCASRQRDTYGAGTASLFENMGGHTRAITTSSPLAQEHFNQGLAWLYGFNHDEAIRSFQKAQRADPNCAMAWWGEAYARGLHINNPQMGEEQSRLAYLASRQAARRINNASPAERALIRAVERRYAWPAPEDRRPLDEAYAAAMGDAYRAFPNDSDVGALYAESLMNLQPWDMWTHDGRPKHRTPEIVAVLEHVMAIAPNHPGANHFYIHAVEASPWPEKATLAAERLGTLVPGSGHLVHMPSHIFIRTGRYSDAAVSNERAIAADESYFAVAPPPDFYSLYFLHNVHFLAYASMMEGRYEAALAAARKIEREIPEEFLRNNVGIADGFMPTTLHVMVRFGKWEDILGEAEPPEWRLLSRAEWHYARAVALANLRRIDEAKRELARFESVAAGIGDGWFMHNNPASSVIGIARNMAAGEIAFKSGDREHAFALLREAVAMEDVLVYDEPPGWMQPVRHALGALLLSDGRASEAEEVYREDLKKHANNGWALIGLRQALEAQGRTAEADALRPALEAAWARADVRPTASCYCHEGG